MRKTDTYCDWLRVAGYMVNIQKPEKLLGPYKLSIQAMRARGWDVVTLDIEPKFEPDIVADLREYHYSGPRPDVMWLSVPCPDYARHHMPWTRKLLPPGWEPDRSIWQAALRLIAEAKPKYWVIENVVGAQFYWGPAQAHVGPFYLWGHFPDIGRPTLIDRKKESYASDQQAERAKVPYAISLALALAVERTMTLPLFAGVTAL